MGDIIYTRIEQGWLYLAVMLNLFSRQVVGWQMSHRIDRDLLCDALQAASRDYRNLITKYHLQLSMSHRGNCWSNAVAESFLAALNKLAVHSERFLTR